LTKTIPFGTILVYCEDGVIKKIVYLTMLSIKNKKMFMLQLYKINQMLKTNPLADVASEVRNQLDHLDLQIPQGPIAITAGSRGIENLALITRTVGDWLKEKGAHPFLVPCMGSHNGATAEGQKAMVESLGLTEDAMGMPIRSSMEVVDLGEVATGKVYMDKHCFESDGVIVLNRIKLHTCFSGPVQSGLAKMMVVGMGKIKSAQTFHSTETEKMKEMILEMGQVVLDAGKIIAGIAILEDGLDQTAEIHAIVADEILEKEPALVEKHKTYFPRLPVDDLKVLVISEMGKTFSGTGLDTNVIGYRGDKLCEDIAKPDIEILAVLNLASSSKGNAIGVGLADFITQALRDAIDEEKTFINVFTTGLMQRCKIPATLTDDKTLVSKLTERFGTERWMFIPNTLHLETLYVTLDLLEELRGNPNCQIDTTPTPLTFKNRKLGLSFD
jgi:hypothetical protein